MKKLTAVLLFGIMATGVTACSTASTVNYNLNKEADEFNVYRKITVTNARTDTIMLQAEGYMSLSNNSSLNDWTCYVMEQTEPNTVDKYHYELVFYPERIIPNVEIK